MSIRRVQLTGGPPWGLRITGGTEGSQGPKVMHWYGKCIQQPTLHGIAWRLFPWGGGHQQILLALFMTTLLSVIIWHSNIQYQIATTKQARSSMLHFSHWTWGQFAVTLNQFHDHIWHKIFNIVIINSVLGSNVSINWVIPWAHRTL